IMGGRSFPSPPESLLSCVRPRDQLGPLGPTREAQALSWDHIPRSRVGPLLGHMAIPPLPLSSIAGFVPLPTQVAETTRHAVLIRLGPQILPSTDGMNQYIVNGYGLRRRSK